MIVRIPSMSIIHWIHVFVNYDPHDIPFYPNEMYVYIVKNIEWYILSYMYTRLVSLVKGRYTYGPMDLWTYGCISWYIQLGSPTSMTPFSHRLKEVLGRPLWDHSRTHHARSRVRWNLVPESLPKLNFFGRSVTRSWAWHSSWSDQTSFFRVFFSLWVMGFRDFF